MSNIVKSYELAKERYAELGVDTDAAIEKLAKIAVSLHCWQGDDVGGRFWRRRGGDRGCHPLRQYLMCAWLGQVIDGRTCDARLNCDRVALPLVVARESGLGPIGRNRRHLNTVVGKISFHGGL